MMAGNKKTRGIAIVLFFIMLVIEAFFMVFFGFNSAELLVIGIYLIVLYGLILFIFFSIAGPGPENRDILIKVPLAEEIKREIGDGDIIDKLSKDPMEVYSYVGSAQNKTYHKHDCRFAKAIKDQYREFYNTEDYFKKNKYKPCKFCIK